MTQELTPNTQITQENVGLLKAGDWLRCREGVGKVGVVTADYITVYINGAPYSRSPDSFTYIGPDLGDGWIGWSGGDNPVPGMRVAVRARKRHWNDKGGSDLYEWRHDDSGERRVAFDQDIIAFRPALSPPAADHIGDATEKVDWARCQRCGGEIQGWICQDCHQEFEENDASELVFCPSESVDWERIGPKLVEALERIAADGEPYRNGYCQTDIAIDPALTAQEAQDVARDALVAAQPQSNGE